MVPDASKGPEMTHRLLLVALSFLPGVAMAQDYRTVAEMQRDALQAESEWAASKKIGHPEIIQVATYKDWRSAPKISRNAQAGEIGWLSWSFRVVSVADTKNMLVGNRNMAYWIEGWPTIGLSDGQEVRIVGACKLTGTKTYTAADSSQKTVPVVQVLSLKDHQIWTANAAQRSREADEKERLAEFDQFTSSNGEHSVRAKFIKNVGTLIYLETADYREIRVQLNDFSEESASHIRKLIRDQKQAGK